ncbi:hypothetical protein GQ600_21929 [Phytophthora cactorum]|nr:hypothetical protein GQ600_21929 [Phytophthora cactorum]
MDLVVTGGCGPCDVLCRRSLLQDNAFNHEALMSKPMFESLFTGHHGIIDGSTVIEQKENCETKWPIMALIHLFFSFRSLRTVSRTLQFQQQTLTYFPSTLNTVYSLP